MIHLEKYLLKVKAQPYLSWSYYSPKASDPVGEWQIEVYLDRAKVGVYKFKMQESIPAYLMDLEASAPFKGEAKLFLTRKIDTTKDLEDLDTIAVNEKIFAYVSWFNIAGSHQVRWRWLNEKKETAYFNSYEFSTNQGDNGWGSMSTTKKTNWNTWAPFTPKQPGKYLLMIFLDDSFVLEKTLNVTDTTKKK